MKKVSSRFSNASTFWNITRISACCTSDENQTHGWHICDVWRNLYNPVIIFYSKMLSCLAERQPRLDKLHVISSLTFLDKGSCVLLLVSLKHPSKSIILPSLATNHSQLWSHFRVNCWVGVWYLFCHIAKKTPKQICWYALWYVPYLSWQRSHITLSNLKSTYCI